jgi:hypothetical protein
MLITAYYGDFSVIRHELFTRKYMAKNFRLISSMRTGRNKLGLKILRRNVPLSELEN